MSTTRPRLPLRSSQLLAVVVAVSLYYLSQWLTDVVRLRAYLPLGSDLRMVQWVGAIDHHVVQLCFALGCIWYLSGGDWRSWGLNTKNLGESKRLLTRGFFPVLVLFLFFGELLVPLLTDTPPEFGYEVTVVNVIGILVFMGIVSGLSEEILFRGFIQTYLTQYFDRTFTVFGHVLPLSGLIAAVIFTVAHVGFTVFPLGIYHLQIPQIALAFVLGIYYAIAYHETESLVAPIVAHNVVNGAIMIATLLASGILT